MRIRAMQLGVCIVAAVVVAGGVASAGERKVPPRTWAKLVCTAARLDAERGIARFAAVGSVRWGPAVDVAEMVVRVEASDELVAGMADVLGGLRAGVESAGVPRIRHGAAVMDAVRGDLDVLLVGLGEMRAVFARFLEDPASDPVAAATQVQTAFEEYLSPEAFGALAEHWPRRLTRAMRRVPVCVVLSEALEEAAAAF